MLWRPSLFRRDVLAIDPRQGALLSVARKSPNLNDINSCGALPAPCSSLGPLAIPVWLSAAALWSVCSGHYAPTVVIMQRLSDHYAVVIMQRLWSLCSGTLAIMQRSLCSDGGHYATAVWPFCSGHYAAAL